MRVTTENFFSRLQEKGYKSKIVSVRHLGDLKEGIEKPHKKGLLDTELFEDYLSGFDFSPPETLKEAISLLVVAIPEPQFQINFAWNEKVFPLMVPPVYLHGRKIIKSLKNRLEEILSRAGYNVVGAKLPVKFLAVRSGLAHYGRNNITYVQGMGSFHRLAAFFSDFPCDEDSWQEVQMLAACEDCSSCRLICPTDAITSERFLLHAERCITYFNEKPGDHPFPDWVDPSWHDCLVGCLRCQRVCPENKKLSQWIEKGPAFIHEETVSFLQKTPMDQLPSATVQKIEQFDLINFLDIFPRNLGVFLNEGKNSK